MPALTSLSSKINNTIHPRCNLSFSNYCLDKWVHLIEDYTLLRKLLSYFERIVSTPNILSEISSLSGQLGDPFKYHFFVRFSKEIELIDERYVRSVYAATMSEFAEFGLTDSVTIDLSNSRFLVLTDDFKLSQYLARSGVDVINFNHIRVSGWT